MAEAARDEEKWDAYTNTILEFYGPDPLRVDLRRPVAQETIAALRERGLDRPFAVLTAENPCGENVEDEPSGREAATLEERNERRTTALETDLWRSGVRFALVDGVAPDGSYRERCVAVLLPQEEAVRLAGRFGQLALFWYDGWAFWLLPALAEKTVQRLPAPARTSS
jgi:hypothetical protein